MTLHSLSGFPSATISSEAPATESVDETNSNAVVFVEPYIDSVKYDEDLATLSAHLRNRPQDATILLRTANLRLDLKRLPLIEAIHTALDVNPTPEIIERLLTPGLLALLIDILSDGNSYVFNPNANVCWVWTSFIRPSLETYISLAP